MSLGRYRLLGVCAALGGGELLAAATGFGAAWPLAAILAAMVVLFGHGLAIPGWRYLAVFLAGVALYQAAAVNSDRFYRESPWLRNSPRRVAPESRDCQWSAFAAIRRDLSRRAGLGLRASPEAAALNRAILLGERSHLPRAVKKAFIDSGTMHVFAISGLHVMVICGVLVRLLSLLLLPKRIVSAVAIPMLWGYVLTIGTPPSAVRAAMMATVYLAGGCCWRRSDLLRAWELTFLIVFTISPRLIVDVGAALSFTVMLALAYAVEWSRGMGWLKAKLFITFAAWAAGAPLSACIFGRVTPGGLLANLVMLPTAEYTVSVGAVGLAVSYVSETLAIYLNNLSAVFTSAMVGISELVSSLPGANFEVGHRPWFEAALWYALLALSAILWRLMRKRRPF